MKNLDSKENLDDEINKKKEVIRRNKLRISQLDVTNERHQKQITILNEFISSLEQQIKDLEQKKELQCNHSIRPEYDDRRYRSFGKSKLAIDMLRVLYYEFFGKDPSISFLENDYVLFGDPTLPIYVSTFLVRGEIPFKIMFEEYYTDYKPVEDSAVAIVFDGKIMTKENYDKYLFFMIKLLKLYSNNNVNLICSDGIRKNYTLAYIGNRDFCYYNYTGDVKEKMYYYFFDLLCDNNWRNIIYIGDTMKMGARESEVLQVASEFVVPHTEFIASKLGMTYSEFVKSNEAFKNHVLKLSKNL